MPPAVASQHRLTGGQADAGAVGGGCAGPAPTAPTAEEAALARALALLGVPLPDGLPAYALFRKPNAKALEAILYHAYGAVKGRLAAKKAFKGIWPVSEKKQQKEFHAKVHEWLKELRDAGVLDAAGATTTSVLRAAVGPRLVSFLCDLLHIAVVMEHARLEPIGDGGAGGASVRPEAAALLEGDPRLLSELAGPLAAVAAAQVDLQARHFAREAADAQRKEGRMEAAAAEVKEEYYSLVAHEARLRQELSSRGLDPEAIIADAACAADQAPAGTLPLPAPAPLPTELAAAHAEAAVLWARLDERLERYADLSGLIDGVVGSEAHPFAIDGAALRAQAVSGGSGGEGTGAEVDIVALLGGWADRVEALERDVAQLAGQGAARPGSRDGGTGSGAVSCSGSAAYSPTRATPLLATADARSHAPHLHAQLGVHRACIQGLRDLEAAIEQELAATGCSIRALRPLVASAAADADACDGTDVAAAAAASSGSQIAAGNPAGAHCQHRPSSSNSSSRGGPQARALPASPMAHHEPAGAPRSRPGALPLVPPTPVLQQLAARPPRGEARAPQLQALREDAPAAQEHCGGAQQERMHTAGQQQAQALCGLRHGSSPPEAAGGARAGRGAALLTAAGLRGAHLAVEAGEGASSSLSGSIEAGDLQLSPVPSLDSPGQAADTALSGGAGSRAPAAPAVASGGAGGGSVGSQQQRSAGGCGDSSNGSGGLSEFASPLCDAATEWLSSAKPRRLSYAAASTSARPGVGKAGAVPLPLAGGAAPELIEQTPAPAGAPLPGEGAAGSGGQALTLMALRARFARTTAPAQP